MKKENHITVKKTARYFTYGDIEKAKHILIAIHGYGYTAEKFIDNFIFPDAENYFVVVPEALSRFYIKGMNGNVGASWMTKDDRTNEINDYVNYLDELYLNVIKPQASDKKIITLGFSQGTETLSRWITYGKIEPDEIIFWTGKIADDIDYKKLVSKAIYIVHGNEDPFNSDDVLLLTERKLKENNVKYQKIDFQGKHEINKEILNKILTSRP